MPKLKSPRIMEANVSALTFTVCCPLCEKAFRNPEREWSFEWSPENFSTDEDGDPVSPIIECCGREFILPNWTKP